MVVSMYKNIKLEIWVLVFAEGFKGAAQSRVELEKITTGTSISLQAQSSAGSSLN